MSPSSATSTAPAPSGPPAPSAPAPVGPVVAVLALAGISVSLMQTLVIPIVSELPALLGSTPTNTAWAITATLLAGAVVTPIAGRLGDMLGKKPVLLASLLLMVVGSVVCAFSDSLVPLVVGRALQGFAAGVVPLGISLMRDVLPAERVGPSTAIMSASLGVGGALGLPAAAVIADHADWHVLFWVAAGLGAVVLVLVATLIPGVAARPGGRLDVVGALGLSAALVGILLGVSKGSDWGWTSGRVLGLLVGGVVLALLWGFFELRTAQPLVDLRTTARRQVLLTNLASLMFGFSMFAMSLVIPQVIQLPRQTGYGLGESMLTAGLAMVPGGLLMMVFAGVSAKVTRAHGAKTSLMIGALVVAVGYGLGLVLMDAVWQLAVVSGVIGAGIGFAYGSLPALIMGAVPVRETASANSFNTLVRSIGTSVSSAVAGAVLAASATTLGGVSVPSRDGFRTILAVAAGTALVALLIASFLPGRRTPAAVTPTAVPAPDEGPAPAGLPQQRTTPPLSVRGTVRSGGALPLAGAVVTLADPGGLQVARGTSDADGRYELPVPRGGTFLLIAAAGHVSPHATLVAVTDQPLEADVTLSGRSALTGRVLRGADGGPVADATVTLTDVTGRVVGSGTTDADGSYSFGALSGGSYVLTTRAGRHRPTARAVQLQDDDALVLDLDLATGGRLRGTVTAGARGTALPDAVLTLVDEDGEVAGRTVADEAGSYAFTDLPVGRYSLTASSHAPASTSVVVTAGPPAVQDVHLGQAPAPLSVGGRAQDPQDA